LIQKVAATLLQSIVQRAGLRGLIMPKDIDNNFTYHAPKEGQPERYAKIRAKAKELAELIDAECPQSRERSIAMTELETSVFWANAAIARNE
jgi:hypothetical protein